jgi:SsrA-binding protein
MELIHSKKAGFEYEFLETHDAGIELLGTEVKSLKNKRGSLEGARVIIRGDEAYLVGANIPAFQEKNAPSDFDPTRTRKLLLKKKEIRALEGAGEAAGLTIVPISMYTKGNLVKLRFAVARGKKKYDKREKIKARETKRVIARTLHFKKTGG